MRSNLTAALCLLGALAACESTSRSVPTYSGDAANDPSNSRIHTLHVSGDAAQTPQAHTIRVAIFRTAVTPQLRKTLKEEKLFRMWRAHFESDSGFHPVSQGKVDRTQRKEAAGSYSFFRLGNAVRVYTVASHRMRAGYDRRQRKVVQVPQLVLTATIEWKTANRKQTVSVQGGFLRNAQLLAELAGKVKQAIRNG